MTPQPELFSNEWKWFAFPASIIGDLTAIITNYGAPAQDGDEVYITVLCGWDDTDQTRKRAVMFGTTASILPCNDGRLRAAGLPSLALINAWENGDIDAEELTEAEFIALAPEGEE
jgi:hypothetical protein